MFLKNCNLFFGQAIPSKIWKVQNQLKEVCCLQYPKQCFMALNRNDIFLDYAKVGDFISCAA
jgi:hypothetical protein